MFLKLLLLPVSLMLLTGRPLASEAVSVCYERWKPYAYVNEAGTHSGESIALLTSVAKKAGLDVVYTQLPFARCLNAVKSGKQHFILHTDKYDDIPLIDVPIAHWQLTLAVADTSKIDMQSTTTLPPLKVLLSRSYSYPVEVEQFLKNINAKVSTARYTAETDEEIQQLFQHISQGRADAMVVDRVWAAQIIRVLKLPIRLIDIDITAEPQFMGYHQSAEIQANALKSALIKITEQD